MRSHSGSIIGQGSFGGRDRDRDQRGAPSAKKGTSSSMDAAGSVAFTVPSVGVGATGSGMSSASLTSPVAFLGSSTAMSSPGFLSECCAVADDLIREYLVFRGFSAALKSFDNEKKADKIQGFSVDRLVDSLFHAITHHDGVALNASWSILHDKFFNQLPPELDSTVRRLQSSLQRLFLVQCVQSHKLDEVKKFFEHHGADLSRDPDWMPWFTLLYCKNPESQPPFDAYFRKNWVESFSISLRNFLSTVFQQHLAHPRILQFQKVYSAAATLAALQQQQLQQLQQQEEMRRLAEEEQAWTPEPEVAAGPHMTGSVTNSTNTSPHERSAVGPGGMFTGTGADGSSVASGALSFQSPAPHKSDAGAGHAEGQNLLFPGSSKKHGFRQIFSRRKTKNYAGQSRDPFGCVTRCVTYAGAHGNSAVTATSMFTRIAEDGMADSFAVSGDNSGTLCCWRLMDDHSTLKHTSRLSLPSGITTSVPLSDRYLLVGTESSRVFVVDCSYPCEFLNNIHVFTPTRSSGPIFDLAVSPRGNQFVVAGANLSLFNLKFMREQAVVKMEPSNAPCTSIQYNRAGNLLATASLDGMVRIFDIDDRTASPAMGWPCHDDARHLSAVLWSADEKSIYALSVDGILTEWSIPMPGRPVSRICLDPMATPSTVPSGLAGGPGQAGGSGVGAPSEQVSPVPAPAPSVSVPSGARGLSHMVSSSDGEMICISRPFVATNGKRVVRLFDDDDELMETNVCSLSMHPHKNILMAGTVDGALRMIHVDSKLIR